MGLIVQLTVGCLTDVCFLQFPVAQVLVELRKQFSFVFLT